MTDRHDPLRAIAVLADKPMPSVLRTLQVFSLAQAGWPG